MALLAGVARAAPAPLSGERGRADVASRYGSGAFGRWFVDGFGLPAYRYRIDEGRDPRARRSELEDAADPTDAWSQLGNDHVVANAYNHGYTQLWSQDRVYEWVNRYSAAEGQYAGGFGYLRAGGRTLSTLYADRPRGARSERVFGTGYARRTLAAAGFAVDEHVYAPFGDDPVLLHDVTIRNRTRKPRSASWFEYWGVNPWEPAKARPRGLGTPSWEPRRRILSVRQAAEGPTGARCGSSPPPCEARSAGTPPMPRASSARAGGPLPPRSPRTAWTAVARRRRSRPGRAHALRAAGAAAPGSRRRGHPPLRVRRRRRARSGGSSPAGGRRDAARGQPAPLGSLGAPGQLRAGRRWLARELQWAAYTASLGRHLRGVRGQPRRSRRAATTSTSFGFQSAFRDPLQHMLPMVYARPALARDVLRYSAREQPAGGGQIAYGTVALLHALDAGPRTTSTCGCCGPPPSTGSPPAIWRSSTAACPSAAAAPPRSGVT